MSAFDDFLGYLASLAWLSGKAVSDGRKAEKIKKREVELARETDLLLAFLAPRDWEISIALGRPYHHAFPEYLRRSMEGRGAGWQEIKKAEEDWLCRSMTGIMYYLAQKEHRPYVPHYPEYAGESFILIKQQEKYMHWYHEAMKKFPHYAVRKACIEEFKGRQSYFNGIEKYRTKGEFADLEPIFGISPPSDDPEYDTEIRRLFYAIDADGTYGLTLEDKYGIMEFLQPYRYHGAHWAEVTKHYMALNRILREEGVDQYDYWEMGCEVYGLRGKIMNLWQTRESKLPFPEKLEKIRELITQETASLDRKERYRKRVLYAMTIQTLLRRDGKDPELYPVELPKKKRR